jgi:hypothetical protein
MAGQQFEQRITPEQEWRQLKERTTAGSPEKSKEIVREHLEQKPEQVYVPSYQYSPEQLSEIERQLTDPRYREKEEAVQRLFEIAREKGLLNAAKMAKNMDPAVEDAFHDRVIKYLHQEQNGDF